MVHAKKPGTAEAWENGELGENLESARVVTDEVASAIQEAGGMQLISIRLPKSVIEDFKVIAQIEGIGYQPLMREALMRFAECEAKRVMREYAAKVISEKTQNAEVDVKPARVTRKAPAPSRVSRSKAPAQHDDMPEHRERKAA